MAGTMIIVFYAFKFLSPTILSWSQQCIRQFVGMAADPLPLSVAGMQEIFVSGCIFFAVAALPMLLISSAASIIFAGAQTRFNVSFDAIKFKGNRLSPIEGFKKMFSMRGLVELLKSIIKVTVLTVIIWNQCEEAIPLMPRMMDMSFSDAMAATGELILSIVQSVAIIFAFVAIFDYGYQWWDYEKNLRMSKQEIKEEYKETEGDPQIKGRIREKQQAASRRRMMQAVPKADVVIRNPTHYAVALKYDPDKNRAPILIAKGADRLALRIVKVAEENGVVVTENRPLARGLYEAVDLDMEIPDRFYVPVAEVLTFVYNLKKKEWK